MMRMEKKKKNTLGKKDGTNPIIKNKILMKRTYYC